MSTTADITNTATTTVPETIAGSADRPADRDVERQARIIAKTPRKKTFATLATVSSARGRFPLGARRGRARLQLTAT